MHAVAHVKAPRRPALATSPAHSAVAWRGGATLLSDRPGHFRNGISPQLLIIVGSSVAALPSVCQPSRCQRKCEQHSLSRRVRGAGSSCKFTKLTRHAIADDDPPESSSGRGRPGDWEWGEIYIWGGVTWTPSALGPTPEEEVEQLERDLASVGQRFSAFNAGREFRDRVWAAVAEQYPRAARCGSFATMPVTPALATLRFARFVEVLGISGEDAAQLVEYDATPLLVEPDGVASAFELLAQVSSRVKALELVRCHPGLLVGGVHEQLKRGAGIVSAALVDLLFAGRLLKVLEDSSRDDRGKLAEIEFYANVAARFKPVMDLAQRDTDRLFKLFQFVTPLLAQVLTFACIHTYLFPLGTGWLNAGELTALALNSSVVTLLVWMAARAAGLGVIEAGLASCALAAGTTWAWAAFLLGLLPSERNLWPLAFTTGAWVLSLLTSFLQMGEQYLSAMTTANLG